MAATAENLRDLHHLHQRARALRDRLSSAPKRLAARQAALAARQAELEAARKAVQDAKVQLKKHEHSLQGLETKIDDLKVKLNQVRKNEEYKALQNQIAHDQTARAKLEEEILLALEAIETQTAEVARREAEVKRVAGETAALRQQIEEQAVAHKSQLQELETAITAAETIIPETFRDRYRRIVARYGADALAACEDGSCLGCFTAVTAQMRNDLINDESLTFCLSCGRLLYLAEAELADPQRN
ncbi:MAG TPA: C4-type zinc ribbon domain-containing protein [Isosphaeraceae bacterium]|nr:C4-type zinc ribbon domain-containing protein [Isosphaeraceae bacterium]